jgi:hypothetical protein
MAGMRIDFEGLVAFEVVEPNEDKTTAKRIHAYFPNPWEHGLHPHAPRLVVPDASVVDWAKTSLPSLPSTAPLSFDLTGMHITLLSGSEPRPVEIAHVSTPSSTIPDGDDAEGRRMLAGLDKVLDMLTLCGDGYLKSEYASASPPKDLVGRMVLDFGEVRTASKRLGNFELWEFNPPHEALSQEAADTVVWTSPDLASLTFFLRSLADPRQTHTITIASRGSGTTLVALRHTCDEPSCGDHRGLHVPIYYAMAVAPQQRPVVSPPTSEGGYCPPSKFGR